MQTHFCTASLPVIFLSYSAARTRPPTHSPQLPQFMILGTDFTGYLSGPKLTSKSPHLPTIPSHLVIRHTLNYLRELISPYQPSRLLRSGKQLLLTVPRAKLAIGQRAFSYSSPVIWNAVPLSVRDAPSVSTFKLASKFKSFYFNSLLSKS